MSIVKNFLGGGTGQSANIYIDGLLSTDNVSATNPFGNPVGVVWGSRVSEGVVIPCWTIKAKDFGNYTIQAVRGSKTISQVCLVDVLADYEVEMSFLLKLYWLGDECESVTGGWTGSNITKNADNISVNAQGAYADTINSTISVEGYTTLYMDAELTAGNYSYSRSTMTLGKGSSSEGIEYVKVSDTSSHCTIYPVGLNNRTVGSRVLSIISGTGFSCHIGNTWSSSKIYRIWLE